MSEEMWSKIPNSKHECEVSNLGNVRRPGNGGYKMLKLNKCGDGFAGATICLLDGTWTTKGVHNLVANAFLGPKDPKFPHILHGDKGPECDEASNLYYSAFRGHPRKSSGLTHKCGGKLIAPKHIVDEIGAQYPQLTLKELGLKHNYSLTTIHRIIKKFRYE